MAINIKKIAVLVIIYSSTVYSTCKKSILGCASSTYSFEIDARIYPDKDTVQVGDTIWVEINSPDVFTDQISNQQINFSNANNLGTDMGFVKLINPSPIQLADAVSLFHFTLLFGIEEKSNDTALIKNFLIKEKNNRYQFKLGITPKDTGTFRFNLGNFVGVYRNGNSCPKADFFTKLVETNQHYYLYPGGSGVTPTGADYYFYVR